MTVLAVACQQLSGVALAHGYMDVSHFKHNVRAEFDQPNVLLILIVSVIVVSFSNTRMRQTYPPGPLNNESMILDIYIFLLCALPEFLASRGRGHTLERMCALEIFRAERKPQTRGARWSCEGVRTNTIL